MLSEIEDVVRSLLPRACPSDDLAVGNRLIEDFGLDSLRIVSLLYALEEASGVELDWRDVDFGSLATINDVLRLFDKEAPVSAELGDAPSS